MAQFVNKFLKVIGIGGGNEAEEVYEDDYENYGEDGYTEEVEEADHGYQGEIARITYDERLADKDAGQGLIEQ